MCAKRDLDYAIDISEADRAAFKMVHCPKLQIFPQYYIATEASGSFFLHSSKFGYSTGANLLGQPNIMLIMLGQIHGPSFGFGRWVRKFQQRFLVFSGADKYGPKVL